VRCRLSRDVGGSPFDFAAVAVAMERKEQEDEPSAERGQRDGLRMMGVNQSMEARSLLRLDRAAT
jgi:hypothetical protein